MNEHPTHKLNVNVRNAPELSSAILTDRVVNTVVKNAGTTATEANHRQLEPILSSVQDAK